jgi:hypothetical protein
MAIRCFSAVIVQKMRVGEASAFECAAFEMFSDSRVNRRLFFLGLGLDCLGHVFFNSSLDLGEVDVW